MAAVCCASTSRRAMVRRRRERRTRSSRAVRRALAAGAGAGWRLGAGAGAAAGGAAAAGVAPASAARPREPRCAARRTASTSSRVTRPPGPVPATCAQVDAMLLGQRDDGRGGAAAAGAVGAGLGRRLLGGARQAALRSAGRWRALGGARSGRGAAGAGRRGCVGLDRGRATSPDAHGLALGDCTIARRATPAASAATSRLTFSVSSSTSGSPAATGSPSLLQPACRRSPRRPTRQAGERDLNRHGSAPRATSACAVARQPRADRPALRHDARLLDGVPARRSPRPGWRVGGRPT